MRSYLLITASLAFLLSCGEANATNIPYRYPPRYTNGYNVPAYSSTTTRNTRTKYTLDHPFYTPNAGHILSETSYLFGKDTFKAKGYSEKGYEWSQLLREKIAVGFTKAFTGFMEIMRDWTKGKISGGRAEHDRMSAYTIGANYNIWDNGVGFAQLGALYEQSFDPNGHGKGMVVSGMVGANLKAIAPYAKISLTRPVNLGHDNHNIYNLFLGSYARFTRILSADLGLDFEKSKYRDKSFATSLVGSMNFLINQNLSLKVNGTYLLHESTERGYEYRDDSYNIGASIKAAF